MPHNQRKTGFIVHLGAGRCKELDDYLAADAARIVLVEPHPECAAFLFRRIRGYSNIELIQKAVAKPVGKAKLLDFNLPGFASLRAPTALKALYPGLRVKRELEVDVISPKALLGRIKIDPKCKNILVIDMPGEEHSVLESLLNGGGLHGFETIVLHAGKSALYEGSRDADSLLQDLTWHGYELEATEHAEDADRPRWTLTRALREENTDALSFYNQLGEKADEGAAAPFILFDSKSLPRSGLHYLKRTLAEILGEQFSFCEWYHEPGCCKSSPCALRAYATHATEANRLHLRLIKSHDFDLCDPVFEPSDTVQRVVLVRDPLYILTSWFSLEQLNRHKETLRQSGIEMPKIWYAHEKAILVSAYKVLDECFEAPDINKLLKWLKVKSSYIAQFNQKWVRPAREKTTPYVHLLEYEDINNFVAQALQAYIGQISPESINSLRKFEEDAAENFFSRKDPWGSRSVAVAEYLSEHKAVFEEAADRVQ